MFKKYVVYALAGLLTLNASAQHSCPRSEPSVLQKCEPELTATGFTALGGAAFAAIAAAFGYDMNQIVSRASTGAILSAIIGMGLFAGVERFNKERCARLNRAFAELSFASLATLGFCVKSEPTVYLSALALLISIGLPLPAYY